MAGWDKTDIIHFLSELYGYSSYLELCTPTTGNRYDKIDRSRFKPCHRLMYRCPVSFDDGMDINFRSPDLRTAESLGTMHALGLRYDVVLVDSFHTYEASYRDMADALRVVTDHGTIIVHDCLPPNEDLVGSDWVSGDWCGVSFVAFIDFVNNHPDLAYATVDTDYGCGVVRKGLPRLVVPNHVADGWSVARRDAKAAFRYMIENKDRLLNLMSVDAFRAAELQRVRGDAGEEQKRPPAVAAS